MASFPHDSAFTQEFPALGEALRGQFQVERELGRGGMGIVYLARDERLDRMVALKVLPAALAAEPQTRERFLREARTAARLAHPNIVPVYRADEAGGSAYFAMAFVDGESLADRVRDRGPLPPADAVPILRDVAWALAYAHARGVVHRDVKPENILLERGTRRTLVTDFGIAHHTTTDPSARLTQDGHVLGTLHFMSPEQINGDALDGRSDVYALGVVAYHVLSGRLPFEGLAAAAVLVAHATKPAPALRGVAPKVPEALASVVDRCLAKSPDDRFATGEALADALEEALEHALADGLELPGVLSLAPGLPARVGEAQAAALWRRAAQLQADALLRREMVGGVVERLGAGRGERTRDVDSDQDGYRLSDVATAAEEAGISRQYVALALAESPLGTLPTAGVSGMNERNATLFLGTAERSLSVSRVMPASPARTLRALGVVLQQAPYELQLRETVGPHPFDGGVIVFGFTGGVVGVMNSSGGTNAGTVNAYWMQTQQALEARQLQVTLRAIPGDPQRTEVSVTCDLRPGVRRNVQVSQWLAGALGSGTGFFTGAVLAKGAAVALSTAVMGPAVAMGLATVGVSLAAYRWAYPGMVDKARREILGALEAVAAAVQSEEVFGTLPGPGRRQRLSDGDDGTATAMLTSI